MLELNNSPNYSVKNLDFLKLLTIYILWVEKTIEDLMMQFFETGLKLVPKIRFDFTGKLSFLLNQQTNIFWIWFNFRFIKFERNGLNSDCIDRSADERQHLNLVEFFCQGFSNWKFF